MNYMPVRSALDFERTGGGSSGGSGGVVGMGITPAALATDTGGSIRAPAPASFNAAYGYRPSSDRWPHDHEIMLSKTRDTLGPIATNVEDIQLQDEVVTEQTHNH